MTEVCLNSFSGLDQVDEVHIPDSMLNFDTAFEYSACIPSLKRFSVDPNNPQYCSDEYGVLYNKDMTTLERIPCGFTGDYTVPDCVIRLQPGYSLYGCHGLTNLYIGANAFDLDDIGNWDYFYCKSLQGIWVDSANPYYCSDSYGALYTKDMATFLRLPMTYQGSYTIYDGVTSIGACAFDGCTNLTGVHIPEGLTFIGDYAFYRCVSLTQLIFPSTLSQLGGWNIIGECSNLATLRFQGGANWLLMHNNDAKIFSDFKGAVYYPNDPSWTAEIFERYPDIMWI